MLCIATTIHDPTAIASMCRRLQVPAENLSGNTWRLTLFGLHAPISINTLTGIITYDRRDNGFSRYRQIMRFVHRAYHAQAERRRGHSPCAA